MRVTTPCVATSADSDSRVSGQTPSDSDRILEPQLASYVMLNTVKRVLGEECVFVADGDADIDIASLAIHHRSPVISNDSDFYIFPLQYGYIPYSKFHWSNPSNNTIYAEFYSYELFCEQFGICDLSLLAVIPAIIGNDMMPQLDSQDRKKILPPDPDCHSLIESVVMHASSFTNLEACIHLLEQQDLIDPADVIENIQEAYNDYFFTPCNLCKPLDILKTTLECDDGSPMPEFVIRKFCVGVYSTFLIRILREQEMYSIVKEDISESWCKLIGIPIRRAIYGILCGNAYITEYQRGENPLCYDEIQIKSVTTIMYDGKEIALPSLHSCGSEIEKDYGKKILFGLLDVKEEDFKKISTDYHLLLAMTHFWYKHYTINKKDVILKAFLLNLQKPLLQLGTTVAKPQGKKGTAKPSAKPIFPIPSFTHALAQWQSLYGDIYNLGQLLQEPLMLLPVSDFLECTYLHSLVEAIIKTGVKKVIQQNGLNHNMYLNFLSAICSAEET